MLDVAREAPQPAAVKDILNFIAGEYVAAKGGKRFDKRSPVTGALIARVSEAGEAEVDAAVKALHPARRSGRCPAGSARMEIPGRST